MDGKDFDVATYVDYDIICTAPIIDKEILNHVNQHTKGKHLLEIGCAEGDFGKLIDCTAYTGIDPYGKSEAVIMGKMCLHFFHWPTLSGLLQTKLKPDGVALFYAIGAETSKIFGNEEF